MNPKVITVILWLSPYLGTSPGLVGLPRLFDHYRHSVASGQRCRAWQSPLKIYPLTGVAPDWTWAMFDVMRWAGCL